MNRKGINQLTVNETQADLEDGQIAAILAVDQMATSLVNGASTDDQ